MLKEDDFLGFSQSNFYNLKIQFADINRDTKIDLVFTGTSFQTGLTQLYYIPNQGSSQVDFSNPTVQCP